MIKWLVDLWLRQCKHNPSHVTFDLLERTIDDVDNVRYCKYCGATRIGRQSEWRRPHPLWCK